VLLSTARRDNGISNPSTPTLIKALSKDGAFFVSGRFVFTQIRTERKKVPPECSEGVLLSTARRDNGISNPSTPTLIKALSKDGAFFVSGRFEFTQIRGSRPKPGDLTSFGIQYNCLFSTFWLDPKSSQKDQDFEFDSLCRSYSEGSSLTSSKGFSTDFVTRCLAHELTAMLSIGV
jgi:hypothetical protein